MVYKVNGKVYKHINLLIYKVKQNENYTKDNKLVVSKLLGI